MRYQHGDSDWLTVLLHHQAEQRTLRALVSQEIWAVQSCYYYVLISFVVLLPVSPHYAWLSSGHYARQAWDSELYSPGSPTKPFTFELEVLSVFTLSPGRSVMSLYLASVIRPGAGDKQQTYQKLKIVPTTSHHQPPLLYQSHQISCSSVSFSKVFILLRSGA